MIRGRFHCSLPTDANANGVEVASKIARSAACRMGAEGSIYLCKQISPHIIEIIEGKAWPAADQRD
jgi:hypothetical protein